jgi:8-oxo-dGTP pyrophosphatase MutT (NUDIX family)
VAETKVAVSTILTRTRDNKIEFLVLKRADNGKWNFPGGKVEPPENLAEAAARELVEETGIEAKPTNILQVFSNGTDDGSTFVFVMFGMYIGDGFGEVKINAEHTESRWVNTQQMKDEIVPNALPRLVAMVDSGRLRTSGCWHRDVTAYKWYPGERKGVGKECKTTK